MPVGAIVIFLGLVIPPGWADGATSKDPVVAYACGRMLGEAIGQWKAALPNINQGGDAEWQAGYRRQIDDEKCIVKVDE